MENSLTINPKKTYTCKEVADILGVSRKSVYRLLDQENIKTIRIGRIIRISKQSFDSWFEDIH